MKKYVVWRCLISASGFFSLVSSGYAQESVAYFDESVIRSGLGKNQAVDLSYLEKNLDTAPGAYMVDVIVNRRFVEQKRINFDEKAGRLEPRLTLGDLKRFGVNVGALQEFASLKDQDVVGSLSDCLTGSRSDFDAPNGKLSIVIPQIFMTPRAMSDDIADEALWQDGDPAFVLSYNMLGSRFRERHDDMHRRNTSFYMGFNARANYGPWRFYSSGMFSTYETKARGFNHREKNSEIWNTYVERDIRSIRSRLRFGEVYTDSEIFDSISMRGIVLENNLEMLPYADRSYTPVISGVARSFAVVKIRQNGRIVYQTNVPPGPWSLSKLPNFGSEGDLEVITVEADGTEHVDFVPYSSVPMMLREGQWRYSVAAGRYGTSTAHKEFEPYFIQGTLKYGLPFGATLYGGALLSPHYQAGALGVALSLGSFGAMSVDATQMHAGADGFRPRTDGTAYRFRYSKTLLATGTTISLVNYRYLTSGYLSFANYNGRAGLNGFSDWANGKEKDRWQLSFAQQLGQWGTLRATGTYTRYHGDGLAFKNYQLVYNKMFSGVGVSLSYGRNYTKSYSGWSPDTQVMLNVDIPLNLFNPPVVSLRNTSVSYQGVRTKTHSGETRLEHQMQARGSIDGTDLSWLLTHGIGDSSAENSTSMMLGYDGKLIGGDLSYTRTKSHDAWQVGANGSLVVHKGGITPAKYAYGSIAVVEIEGAGDAKINRGANVYTNSDGYAVVTNLRNYAENEIVVDPSTLPEGALLLEDTTKYVYPSSHAVVNVKFPVRLGRQAFFTLLDRQGNALPFGVNVKLIDETGKEDAFVEGIVGENGRFLLSGIPVVGKLRVKTNANGFEEELFYSYKLQKEAPEPVDGFRPIEQLTLYPDGDTAVSVETKTVVTEPSVHLRPVYFTHVEDVTIAYLTDETGAPLPRGASVIVFDKTGKVMAETRTEEKGRFWIKGPILHEGTVRAVWNDGEQSLLYEICDASQEEGDLNAFSFVRP